MRNRKLGRKRWIIPPMIIFLMVTLAVIVITALLAPVIAPIDLGASDLTQRLKMPKFKDPHPPIYLERIIWAEMLRSDCFMPQDPPS